MSMSLLPANFDQLITTAVREFWSGRGNATGKTQGGARDAVVGGKNMDGFVEVVRHVVAHCGLPDTALRTRRSQVVLPTFALPKTGMSWSFTAIVCWVYSSSNRKSDRLATTSIIAAKK